MPAAKPLPKRPCGSDECAHSILTITTDGHGPTNKMPPDPQHNNQIQRDLARNLGVGSLLVALVVGVQLGSLPWRYRRELWQLQGFAMGALLGYVVGRLSGRVGQSGSPGKGPGIGQD